MLGPNEKARIRNEIMSELAEAGSELHNKLREKFYDNNAFYKILDETNYRDESIRQNLEALTDEGRELKKKISIAKLVNFVYLPEIGRFIVDIRNEEVTHVKLSKQICYVLGYEEDKEIKDQDTAKYSPDMRGGVSHICVYIENLYDEMAFGDSLAPLLQVVTVFGNPGDIIEKRYDSPMFSRVKVKEVNEIGVELKTLTNRYVPFDYGTVICTLYFKKLVVL